MQVPISTATTGVAIALLLILSVAAAIGRGILLREDSTGTKRSRPSTGDRAARLNLRDPRDLLIVIVAIALGAVSVAILLGIELGL
jgi:hypothetical protein